MVANLALGLITPPVGACSYIDSVGSGLQVEKIIKSLSPFYIVLALALVVTIQLPQMSKGFANYILK